MMRIISIYVKQFAVKKDDVGVKCIRFILHRMEKKLGRRRWNRLGRRKIKLLEGWKSWENIILMRNWKTDTHEIGKPRRRRQSLEDGWLGLFVLICLFTKTNCRGSSWCTWMWVTKRNWKHHVNSPILVTISLTAYCPYSESCSLFRAWWYSAVVGLILLLGVHWNISIIKGIILVRSVRMNVENGVAPGGPIYCEQSGQFLEEMRLRRRDILVNWLVDKKYFLVSRVVGVETMQWDVMVSEVLIRMHTVTEKLRRRESKHLEENEELGIVSSRSWDHSAGRQFHQNAAQRPHVNCAGDPPAAENFRSSEGTWLHNMTSLGVRALNSKTKISDFQFAAVVTVEEDICRFEIGMDDVVLGQKDQSTNERFHHFNYILMKMCFKSDGYFIFSLTFSENIFWFSLMKQCRLVWNGSRTRYRCPRNIPKSKSFGRNFDSGSFCCRKSNIFVSPYKYDEAFLLTFIATCLPVLQSSQ